MSNIELTVTEDLPIELNVPSDSLVRLGVNEQIINSGGGGMSDDVKQALLDLIEHLAFIDADGQDYYDALYAALYPPVELDYITAVYTQSGTVYDTDSLDSLKADLVVTAYYDDGTSAPVTAYTLSGTLTAGTSTITVSYGGKTTTFNVTVTESAALTSITAVYTQSGAVLETDSLDSLKDDLVVTAHYSDSSTSTVASTDYTLSGTLTVGTSTITVTYSGKTTTFTVTVSTNYADDLADWYLSTEGTSSYSDGVITLKGAQSEANSFRLFAFARAKTLWDTVNGKRLSIKVTMDSPDWSGAVSTVRPQNQVVIGVSIFKNASVTTGGDRQRSKDLEGGIVLTAASRTFEYTFDAAISSFDTGSGTPTSASTFGLFIYNASANTVHITGAEITEVPSQ